MEKLINNSSQFATPNFNTNTDFNNNINDKSKLVTQSNKTSNYSKIQNLNSKSNQQIVNEAYFNIKAGLNQDEYFIINNDEFYSNLLIDSYKLSVYMNGIFRNIKENKNLDYLEESDDEDEFNDDSSNKYTDIDKTIIFKCKYNKKFKKWTPIDCNNYNSITPIHIVKNIEKYI